MLIVVNGVNVMLFYLTVRTFPAVGSFQDYSSWHKFQKSTKELFAGNPRLTSLMTSPVQRLSQSLCLLTKVRSDTVNLPQTFLEG